MPTTEYPKNPNTDTAFVTDDNNHRTRAVKTVLMDGTIDYPTNPNSDSCYVTVDGKKQRALMIADISSEGTLDYPENSNSTKGYVTVNGKKQRVILTAALVGGGSAPVIDELNITPSTSAQTITAPEGTDGYSPVNVSAVTSAIDANITAGNIKKDVQILGVTGSYEGQTPTGTKSITTNGIYDVAGYANADVQVPTTAPDIYIEYGKVNNTVNKKYSPINLNGITIISNACFQGAFSNCNINNQPITFMSGITEIKQYGCYEMFKSCTNLTSIDLSSLITIDLYGCSSMFEGCTGLTSANLSSLTTIGFYGCQNMFKSCTSLTNVDLSSLTNLSNCSSTFYGCTSLTTVDLSSATSISGSRNMFQGCTSLTTVDLSGVETISGSSSCNGMFQGCTSLTTVDLSSLKTIGGSGSYMCAEMFQFCTSLTTISFDNLLSIVGGDPCNTMFRGCTNLTTVSFNKLNEISRLTNNTADIFYDCPKIESVSFGGLKASTFASRRDQIERLFNNVSGSQAPNGCTVHFPSNFDPSDPNHTFDASTLTGYPTFCGDAQYIHVAFDLPATE